MHASQRMLMSGLIVWTMSSGIVTGAPPTVATGKGLAVDTVALKGGASLRGAILEQKPDRSVTIGVTRAWLETAQPELAKAHAAEEVAELRKLWTTARDRAASAAETEPAESPYGRFLRGEVERLEGLLAADPVPRPAFVVLELAGARVQRVTRPPLEQQRWAVLAWKHGWVDVEHKAATTLKRELVDRDIPLDGPLPDLSDRFPPLPQDEREWAARRAMLAYAHGRRLDFQGTREVLVPTSDEGPPALATILPQLLQSQLRSQLQGLLGEGVTPQAPELPQQRLDTAIKTATDRGVRGFRVTWLDLAPERQRVTVETRFYAQFDDQSWRPVWGHQEAADSNQPRPDLEAQIAADPQIATLRTSLAEVGLPTDSLEDAFRTGAATMAALTTANRTFEAFLSRYMAAVERPKLLLPSP
jgi:hypothetical protein